MNKSYFNYFGENEQESMGKFSSMRTKALTPALRILDAMKLTPDSITFISFLCVLLSAYWLQSNITYAAIALVVHILLDAVDGSLARYQDRASNKGALLDICNDQAGLVIIGLSVIAHQLASPFWVSLYLISYIVMIVFLVALNHYKKPIKFVIRSKYIFFAVLFLDLSTGSQFLQSLLFLGACYNVILNFVLLQRLRCSV